MFKHTYIHQFCDYKGPDGIGGLSKIPHVRGSVTLLSEIKPVPSDVEKPRYFSVLSLNFLKQ